MPDQAEDIFDGDQSQNNGEGGETQPDTASTSEDTFNDLLKSITADDGRQKYSNVNQALESIPHAQKHIRTLEEDNANLKSDLDVLKEEMAKLQEELGKRKSAEEILESMSNTQDNADATTSMTLDEDAISGLVERVITQRETQRTAQQNITVVVDKFKEKFGEKAASEFYSQAEAAGLDRAMANTLAAKSPTAVFKMLGLETKTKPSSEPRGSSVNSAALSNNTQQNELSAKVSDRTTEGMVNAWRNAGKKVRGES